MRDNLLVLNGSNAAERFDSEVVLINVEKGLYYSIQGSAVDVYDAFAQPRRPGEVLDALCSNLAGADRAVLSDTIDRMIAAELLVPANAAQETSGLPFSVQQKAFVIPALSIFDDLAELIAIDPVHEVDPAAGWPVRPPKFPDVG